MQSATTRQWGANIKLFRETLELSRADLAREVGVHRSVVGRWEAGHVEPKLDNKIKLANVLHTDARILFPMVGIVVMDKAA